MTRLLVQMRIVVLMVGDAAWELRVARGTGLRDGAGFTMSDGTLVEAQQKIDGGPSVLYDAVVILASEAGTKQLAADATTKDFLSDAFAHCKLIGYVASSKGLLDAAGIQSDDGMVALNAPKDISAFLAQCHDIRFWSREQFVNGT